MIIELIRHGKTALQEEGRYQGRTDAPLSEKGLASLCPCDAAWDLLCVTRLIRTQQTAAKIFPGTAQMVVPGLEEMNFGVFEGRNYKEMQDDAEYRRWVDGMCEGRCPGGESRAEFCDRVNGAFLKLLHYAADNGVNRLAIVAHGGTLMAVLERFCTEHRSYFDWHTESGKGYLLLCENPEGVPELKLLKQTDHTGGKSEVFS